MVSLFDVLQLEIHIIPAAILLILLLPFSSHHKVRYYGCFIVYVFLVSSISLLIMPLFFFRPKNVKNCILAAHLMKHITKLVGIQWELRGGDILGVERGAVIVANHRTVLDILGIFNIWAVMGKCATVAKKQLFYYWPFGLSAWLAGVVFIDRQQTRQANCRLDEASRLIVEEKTKLWLFPEGTRNNNPESLMPFKRGAFRVAVACQAPIIPVLYSPYYFIDYENKYFGHGKVIIQCLEPVPTEGKTDKDIDALIEEVRGRMVQQYELLKQEVAVYQDLANKDLK